MDLTRITLPTFILERRSTLEMYADFLAHADLWAAIPDAPTPKDRMVSCLRWYLSAFHAGRRSSLAKKPYNPILGEVFRCYWSLDDSGVQKPKDDVAADDNHTTHISKSNELHHSGPVPWAPRNAVVFLAEQVSLVSFVTCTTFDCILHIFRRPAISVFRPLSRSCSFLAPSH